MRNGMSEPLALVFTMEKVGSSTVMNALRSIGRNPERGYARNYFSLRSIIKYEAIITMVRDPISWGVSLFFEQGERELDNFRFDLDYAQLASNWFYEWSTPVFGCNITSKPFSRKKGWEFYNNRVLLIRTEDLTEKLPEAFGEIFGVDPSIVDSEHRAETVETREYGAEYQDFIDNLRLPEELLDKIYLSDFVNHFYYKKEIAEFRKRWS